MGPTFALGDARCCSKQPDAGRNHIHDHGYCGDSPSLDPSVGLVFAQLYFGFLEDAILCGLGLQHPAAFDRHAVDFHAGHGNPASKHPVVHWSPPSGFVCGGHGLPRPAGPRATSTQVSDRVLSVDVGRWCFGRHFQRLDCPPGLLRPCGIPDRPACGMRPLLRHRKPGCRNRRYPKGRMGSGYPFPCGKPDSFLAEKSGCGNPQLLHLE